MIRVLAIVPYQLNRAPSQRFRIEQWAPYLSKQGIDITFAPFENEALGGILREPGRHFAKAWRLLQRTTARLADVATARRFDVVFLHREVAMIGPAMYERVMKAAGIPLIYDFDDAIYLPPTTSPNGLFSRLKMPGKTATICRLADHVFAGNRVLFDYARKAGGNATLVPTTIDMSKYVRKSRPSPVERVTIGWSGSRTTSSYVELIREPLQELRKHHDFKLLLIGAEPTSIPGVDVEILPWCADTEVEDLSRIDIGLMPLPDDQWARGKCALKALQYMALGIPTVTSPVGMNAELITDRVNGALASSPAEWVTRLEELLISDERRREVGNAGRDTVLRAYSAESQLPAIVSLFRDVAARRTRS